MHFRKVFVNIDNVVLPNLFQEKSFTFLFQENVIQKIYLNYFVNSLIIINYKSKFKNYLNFKKK